MRLIHYVELPYAIEVILIAAYKSEAREKLAMIGSRSTNVSLSLSGEHSSNQSLVSLK